MKKTLVCLAAKSLLHRPQQLLQPPLNLPPHLHLLRQEACRPVPQWRHVAAMTDWMLPPAVSRLRVIEELPPVMSAPKPVRVRFRPQSVANDDLMPMEVLAQ